MGDAYDREVKRLSSLSEERDVDDGRSDFEREVDESWASAEPLFRFCGPDPDDGCMQGNGTLRYGCLTLIRANEHLEALTPELAAEIRADGRIPDSVELITKESLPAFAEWQRRLDAARRGTEA